MNTQTIFEYVGDYKMQESDCIAIAFFRPTTSNPVSVNGLPIEAGQTFRVEQNVGDMDRTQYEIIFSTGTATNELYVMRSVPLFNYKKG